MHTTTRFTVFAGAIVLSLALPSAVSADCGGAALTALARTGAGFRVQDVRPQAVAAQNDQIAFDDHRPLIVGLWKVTMVADGAVIDIGFDAWHGDGTETLNDASPVSHNVCLGVWAQTGRRTFQLKHPAFRYDAAGNVIGTLVLRETNVVNVAGNRFTGTFTIQFFDLAGAMVFEGSGQITGERVTVD
jgi:hypothetical protein